jgi:hypothetical protein
VADGNQIQKQLPPEEGFGYSLWMAEHMFLFVPAQAKVKAFVDGRARTDHSEAGDAHFRSGAKRAELRGVWERPGAIRLGEGLSTARARPRTPGALRHFIVVPQDTNEFDKVLAE